MTSFAFKSGLDRAELPAASSYQGKLTKKDKKR